MLIRLKYVLIPENIFRAIISSSAFAKSKVFDGMSRADLVHAVNRVS
jgi:hypothetical protein